MPEVPISIDQQGILDAAAGHADAAAYLRTVPQSNDDIQTSLDSLGPIFAELREEGRLKLDERRQCYEGQADQHEHTHAKLMYVQQSWEQGEDEAREQFRKLIDGV